MRMVTVDGRGYGKKTPEPSKETGDKPKVWLVVSYVLLALGGIFGLHRLYNRQPIMAFAQALFSVYILLDFGSWISLYLGVMLVAWLVSDAVSIPKWIEAKVAARAAATA
jgi:TM2 domain-containing membrane protein YozV